MVSVGNGGMRVGAGRPPKLLEDKLLDGDIKNAEEIISQQDEINIEDESDIPETPDYLRNTTAANNELSPNQPDNEIKKMFLWIKRMGCEKYVPHFLIEQYAMNRVRWIQTQEQLSKTTLVYVVNGKIKTNPLVSVQINYEKAMNNTFMLINSIVRSHCTNGYRVYQAEDVVMENLID